MKKNIAKKTKTDSQPSLLKLHVWKVDLENGMDQPIQTQYFLGGLAGTGIEDVSQLYRNARKNGGKTVFIKSVTRIADGWLLPSTPEWLLDKTYYTRLAGATAVGKE